MGLMTLGSANPVNGEETQRSIDESDDLRTTEDWQVAWDDVTDEVLRPDLVCRARQEEIE